MKIMKVIIIMQIIGEIRTLMKILKMNNKEKRKKKKRNRILKLIMKIWIKILIGFET